MDTRQIEYILQIAEENNITKAAEKLFITQPALNQQLLKLEKELGTPLFHRSRSNWRLTEAGEIYVRNAKQILQIKKNTYEQIRDVANRQKGILSIGFTPGRGVAIFGKETRKRDAEHDCRRPAGCRLYDLKRIRPHQGQLHQSFQ